MEECPPKIIKVPHHKVGNFNRATVPSSPKRKLGCISKSTYTLWGQWPEKERERGNGIKVTFSCQCFKVFLFGITRLRLSRERIKNHIYR